MAPTTNTSILAGLIMFVLIDGAIFGTLGGVIWRQRGGQASDGFWIGAIFGIFGLAWCALATPRARRTVIATPRDVPSEPQAATPAPAPVASPAVVPAKPYRHAPSPPRARARMGAVEWLAVASGVLAVGALLLFAAPHAP